METIHKLWMKQTKKTFKKIVTQTFPFIFLIMCHMHRRCLLSLKSVGYPTSSMDIDPSWQTMVAYHDVTTRPTWIKSIICELLISLKSWVTNNFHHGFKLGSKLLGQSVAWGFGVLQMVSEPILIPSGWWGKPHQGMMSPRGGMFVTS